MADNQMTLICALHFAAARRIAQERGLDNGRWLFAFDRRVMQGFSPNTPFIVGGSHRARPDWLELEDEAKAHGFEIIEHRAEEVVAPPEPAPEPAPEIVMEAPKGKKNA
jgi:hypothetical protein